MSFCESCASLQRELEAAKAERVDALLMLGNKLSERMQDEMVRRCKARIANIRAMSKDDPQFQSYQWAANAMEQDLHGVILGIPWPDEPPAEREGA